MIRALTGLLKGAVRVKVSGKNPERLVNLCLDSGIPIWDLKAEDGQVFFTMPLSYYRGIRPLARRARCVPRITRRSGVPFFVGKVKKRRAFLLAGMLVILLFLYLSGSVWDIRVKGAYTVDEDEVLNAAASHGLRIGARKAMISVDSVESGLIRDIPRLSWVYIHFQGSLAVIEIVEKVRPDASPPGDIVAAKDGVVTSVLVLSGTPVVKAGDTVQRGELLIAGNTQGAIQGARGTVMAKTWYEVYREIPLNQSVPVRTGLKSEVSVIRSGGRELILNRNGPAFEWYEVEEYPMGSVRLPYLGEVQAATLVFYEIEWEERTLTVEEAREIAEKQARESLRRRLPSTAELIDLSCEVEAVGGEVVALRFLASAIEDVGTLRSWPETSTGVDR